MGVSQAAVNWFDSYLGGRMQAVEISGVFSEFRSVTCGVPQGSILGPLLFLIYVNDMKAAVNCKLLLYGPIQTSHLGPFVDLYSQYRFQFVSKF